jgi:hypothetical protein
VRSAAHFFFFFFLSCYCIAPLSTAIAFLFDSSAAAAGHNRLPLPTVPGAALASPWRPALLKPPPPSVLHCP